MKIRKLLALFSLTLCLLCSLSSFALAAPGMPALYAVTDGGGTPAPTPLQTSDVQVTGTVEPCADALITLPTEVTFVIDANRAFYSSDCAITTTYVKPITVKNGGISPKSGTSTVVVDPAKFSDWTKLSAADTRANIALKLGAAWLHASNAVLGTTQAGADQVLELPMEAKYGWDWGNAENLTLQYALRLIFS